MENVEKGLSGRHHSSTNDGKHCDSVTSPHTIFKEVSKAMFL